MEKSNDKSNKFLISSIGAGIDLDQIEASERQTILVVEDDLDSIYLLKQILRLAGFNVMSSTNGREAVKKVADYPLDLVLLDIMMPEMNGWEVLDEMRKIKNIPVIVISALGTKEDIVNGLHRGVDDYISKPFYNNEVSERVKAVLRRAHKPQELSKLVFQDINLIVDLFSQEVILHDEKVRLTPKEFAVLSLLAKNAPAVVSYDVIGQAVWGEDSPEVRRRTKYLIYLLRRKFERVNSGKNFILNFDRLGYKLQTD